MTHSVGKRRRNGILVVIAVFVVVCAWWAFVVPRIGSYKRHQRAAKIEEALENVRPPAGARSTTVDTLEYAGVVLEASRFYGTTSDWESVKGYYKEEFPKHGFAYVGEDEKSQAQNKPILFSSTEYKAHLDYAFSQGGSLVYRIGLSPKHL